MTRRVQSYLAGEWTSGRGDGVPLYNPTTEQELARASTEGLDVGAGLRFARDVGGPALRALTFAERGAVLKAMAQVIHEHRDELIEIAVENGGNTRGDAKFDIDGASFTLAHYAKLGATLGARRELVEGDLDAVGRSPRLVGGHLLVPRPGVAIQINAFNFPAWGFGEKAACALLAGLPVLCKPAPATALLAERLLERLIARELAPKGALSLLAGEPGDLLDHVEPFDVVAFTGSGATGALVRGHPHVVRQNVRVSVEADSVNAAVLATDVKPGDETYDLFLTETVREMTQKAGQKCTATRRLLVPAQHADAVQEHLVEALARVRVGAPALREVGMGPLSTREQLARVRAGLEALRAEAEPVFGDGGRGELLGVDGDTGWFMAPVLLRADAARAERVHREEVFGPVATLLPYSGDPDEAAELVNKGKGGLVASIYTDKKRLLEPLLRALAPYHGRLYLGSKKIAGGAPGPGVVMPMLVHGGPGRAGGGEELGGLRGVAHYMQRTALTGDGPMLDKVLHLDDDDD
jgi:3,4-dehydroadipyl-CoA semialdehyde dehydrogenase